jgi:hypothetical protein
MPDSQNPTDLGEEPTYFRFSAALRIFGEGIDIDSVTQTLGLEPTHAHRKGERRSATAAPWEHDMWSYQAQVEDTEPLEAHIMALWNAIRPNIAYLRELKGGYQLDVFCGYRSNSDTAGFEVSHRCLGLFTELEVPFCVSVIIT